MPIPVNLIASLAGEVHLFHPAKAMEVARVLTSEERAGPDWEKGVSDLLVQNDERPYRIQDGMAIIPVRGSLLHQHQSVRPHSGSTGYDGIRAAFTHAIGDSDVTAVMIEINSAGGMVSGCAEVAALIGKSSKPVGVYVDAMAYSAAYWIASQADVIVATPTAGVGSIGALTLHVDQSGAAEKHGLSFTIVHSGKHKIDGNPMEPLPDDVRADMQARLDATRADFATAVGEGRGDRFTAAQAMATEARDYKAPDALSMGMIDAIAPPENAFSTIADLLGLSSATKETGLMTDTTSDDQAWKAAQEAADAIISQARKDAAEITAKANESAAAMTAEASRIAAITAMDAPQSVKEVLAGEGFKGVDAASIQALADAIPDTAIDTMEKEGGAGVQPDPKDIAPSGGKTERADEAADRVSKEEAVL